MESVHTFYKNRGFVKVVLSGKYSIKDFKALYNTLLQEMTESEINSILWNARSLDITEVSQDQIRSIIAWVGKEAKKRQGGKAAWVAHDELGFGMARMFEIISDGNIDISIQIFRDLTEAEKWIAGEDG